MITVLLVDDERLVCAHLRTILEHEPDITVVGECFDGAAAAEMAVELAPDLILMDLRMPVLDGVGTTERIRQLDIDTHVVVLTTFSADDYVLRALAAGASGFILKSTAPADLAAMVRVAASGITVFSPEASSRLTAMAAEENDRHMASTTALEQLTARERDVLRQIAAGRTNAEIGRDLSLAETTVKGHVTRILEKLGCTNRTQAGLLAHQYL